MMHTDLVHIISKSLTRAVRPAEHFLKLLESSDEWQKDYRFPKIFPASFSCCKFGKMTPSMCVCVCVSGVGANGLEVEVSLPK